MACHHDSHTSSPTTLYSDPDEFVPLDLSFDSEVSSLRGSRSSSIFGHETTRILESSIYSESFPDLPLPDRQYIAVVGGLGYIGSHTSLELLKGGYNIIIIDNFSNSYRGVYGRIQTLVDQYYRTRCGPAPLMILHEADYRDAKAMKNILEQYIEEPHGVNTPSEEHVLSSRIKGVIHFAAYKSVSESIKNPLSYYLNNVAGTVEFCSMLNSFNIKTFIFSSSATVYGSIANSGKSLREEYCTHATETFVDEDGKMRTTDAGSSGLTNPYGRSKWMCEAILSDLAIADPEWTIVALRYFNPVGCDESGLLGEDPRGAPTNLLPVVVKVMTGQSALVNVYGTDYPTPDGTAIRDFIHVTDLAHGHIAALAAAASGRVAKGFRTYNLGSGTGNSVLDVVTALEAVSSSKIPLNMAARRDGDVGICVAMPSRAEVELQWTTKKSLDTCCRDIWNFLERSKA
ncbi:UDP-glucose 4-epimerase [Phlyctema vagabunda]|uniref:UDP-glucose 4-epimerase n=1 Tax=Phlyctema vagabunda TaxID=108571 RepID=A0ABR4PMY6_9HELO